MVRGKGGAKLVMWGRAGVSCSEKKREVQRPQDEKGHGMCEELEPVGEGEAGRVDGIQITVYPFVGWLGGSIYF